MTLMNWGNRDEGVDLFVRSLEQEGVEYIFGVPGEETLSFLEPLRESRIRFILTRDEVIRGVHGGHVRASDR